MITTLKRHFERGIIATVWLYVAAGLAVLAMLWGVIHSVTSYLHRITEDAHKAGEAACDKEYKGRDNAALQAALGRVQELETRARKSEREHSLALGRIDVKLKEAHDYGLNAEKRVLDDIATGRLRVRGDAFQARDCPAVGPGSAGAAPVASAARSDDPPRCELSAASAVAILAIGREADAIVAQLAAAQAVIIEDRRICGAQ